jgi:hypothetical protein
MNQHQTLFLFFAISAFSANCVSQKEKISHSEISSNGELTSEYPFVRRIDRRLGNSVRVATGVLLANGFMMVPAHFLDRTRKDCGIIVDGITPAVCRIHPQYDPNDRTDDGAQRDFGFLYFPSRFDGQLAGKPSSVRLGAFNVGQINMDVTLIGFGSPWVDRAESTGTSSRETGGDLTGIGGDLTGIGGDLTGIGGNTSEAAKNGQATDGKKRRCSLKLERELLPEEIGRTNNSGKVGIGVINIKFELGGARTCIPAPGDSGAPIFDSNRNLVGIASRVGYTGPRLTEATFVSISNRSLLQFMADSMRERTQMARSGQL